MSAEIINQRLRLFLYATGILIFLGTLVELVLEEHTGSAAQYIPFVLSILGLLGVLLVLWRPQGKVLLALRVLMVIVFLGSLFGILEHTIHNFEFALDIRPNAVASDVWWEALSGANPLLAPGILALGALLVLAGSYSYPALRSGAGSQT